MTTQLYLIRHGETVANVELIIGGMRGDAGLTDPLAWVAAKVGSPGSIARASPVVSRTPSRLRWCSAMARFASSIAAVVGSGGGALLPSGVGLVQFADRHLRGVMQRLADALEAIGRNDVEVRLVTIRTAEEARRLGFTGSPTILIDGRAPFAPPQAVAALSCRLYPTAQGTSGSPSIDQLTAALLGRDQPGSKQ